MTVADTIKQTVTTNNVVLFMKGTKSMPQCGFSSRVAGVLNFMGVEFADVNVLAWNGHVSNLLATGGDDGMLSVWDLRNFRPGGAGGGGDGDAPAPLARFTAHRNPITGLEWHPTDESMLAVSDEAGAYIYDLSIEEDEPQDGGAGEGAGGGDGELPPQLLFVHCGSESVKEVHWHPQVASMVMTTALSGFSLFIPSNL